MSGVLITGFPGFIAGRLVRRLVEHHDRLLCLVESRFLFRAEDRLRALEAEHPALAGRWHVLEGDIRRPDLGMTAEALDLVRETVGTVWHLAALYDLATPLPPAYAVNVEGTLQVLDLCESLPKLERLDYISTCYVAGDRTGRVYEDELDTGQGFKNHYESTKCWAEKHVQRRMGDLPTAIYRPSIVVGDSRTGETAKGDGPYYVLRLLLETPRWLPMAGLGPGEAPVNLVPVDWLIESLDLLGRDERAIGGVFHLADPQPMTAAEILDAMIDELGRAPAVGNLPVSVAKRLLKRSAVRRLLGIPRELVPYFNHPVEFDVTHTAELLEGQGRPCPPFASYLPRLIAYAQEHPEIFAEVR